MASTYLSRTPSSTGNRKIWTLSTWVKRSVTGSGGVYYSQGTTSGALAYIGFNATDLMEIAFDTEASGNFRSNMVFRDLSAWYHIVIACDTTQATASNRVKAYVNGSQITFGTELQPSQNYDTQMNTTTLIELGKQSNGAGYFFNGLLAHYHFIDGTAYAASDFGSFDANGIWTPNASPSVTYGTNGFFLDMANSSDMGNDVSGNNNDFTVTGTVTQSLDTPSNVFCVINSLSKGAGITLSNGNTSITNGATWYSAMATIMPSTGKWYWENKVASLGTVNCGVTKSTQDGTNHANVDAGRSMYSSNGTIYNEGLASSDYATGTTFTTNDIIGVAIDIAGNTIAYYKNGSLIHTVSDSGISAAEGWSPAWGMNSGTFNVNFGNGYFGTTAVASGNADSAGLGIFEYTVPSGYYSLCTKNIATYG